MTKKITTPRLSPINPRIPTGLPLQTTTSGTPCDIHEKYCGVFNRVAVPPRNADFLYDYAENKEIENVNMRVKRNEECRDEPAEERCQRSVEL
jgi:hypothetical protein